MRYISQNSLTVEDWAKNACGAFAVAYYLWESGKVKYSGDDAAECVKKIYNSRGFKIGKPLASGCSLLNEDYSNPASMRAFLTEKSSTAQAYCDGDSQLARLLPVFGIDDCIDVIDGDGYLIGIFRIDKSLHYILVRIKGGRWVQFIDPVDGEKSDSAESELMSDTGSKVYQFQKAGIWIPG
ncbi:MAG: hypothetical protein FWB97_03440 [Oscillospiraceae bacterium]|nr:hypothetical protein [Oscillospiraceae bacterium]